MGLQERLEKIEKYLDVLNERTEILRDHFNKSNEILYKNERALVRTDKKISTFIDMIAKKSSAVELPKEVVDFLMVEENLKLIQNLISIQDKDVEEDENEEDEEEIEEPEEMDLQEVKNDLVKINEMLEKIDKYLCE